MKQLRCFTSVITYYLCILFNICTLFLIIIDFLFAYGISIGVFLAMEHVCHCLVYNIYIKPE